MYGIYKVMENDTVDEMINKFGITKEELYKINGFSDEVMLVPNMELVVPKNVSSSTGNYWYYTVKKGDSPYQIAKQYKVDYQMLLALNGLDENDYIYPNQSLLIPKDGVRIYVTHDDDTIRGVMESNHVYFDELLKENENIYLKAEQFIVFREK